MKKIKKEYLEELVQLYETPDFIKNDPEQFPHRYTNQADIEVSALVSSSFSYGSRKKIIETLENIHKSFNGRPAEFAINFNIDRDKDIFKGFIYRYNDERDLSLLIHIIGKTLLKYKTLENAFLEGYNPKDKTVRQSLSNFVNILRKNLPCDETKCRGIFHLIPSPELGSACKRLNLFLKWLVRKPPVDLNLWKNIKESQLIIPLDTHVARISRKWHFTGRNANDWKTAEEITENLRKFDAIDPVKYDFAIFGLGIDGRE